ncbi:hypothetical protein llap_5222 [Limosa lapponica baueri]|uniref:Uncharacterized protein n=1 Tax=Limosa lapponica baueri TaxID=1758121 RepID=A0A2I0UEJ3_LIMLA|nr:hypothetical protein llap_5222 [Limosa lapponica baueri]
MGPGFSISWCAPTAYSDISPEGKAFAFPLKSYITWQSTLIKNVESGFAAGSLQGFKREHFTALYILSDNTRQVYSGSEYPSQLKHRLEECHRQAQLILSHVGTGLSIDALGFMLFPPLKGSVCSPDSLCGPLTLKLTVVIQLQFKCCVQCDPLHFEK